MASPRTCCILGKAAWIDCARVFLIQWKRALFAFCICIFPWGLLAANGRQPTEPLSMGQSAILTPDGKGSVIVILDVWRGSSVQLMIEQDEPSLVFRLVSPDSHE